MQMCEKIRGVRVLSSQWLLLCGVVVVVVVC